MEYRRSHGADALFALPLIDAGAQTYLAAIPTIAAGDVKAITDAQVSTNPTCFILGFDSMDAEPQPGDVIHEADAGDGQATVMFVVITSGTVGAGTAAGFMFVKSVSGTWTDDAVIDIDSPTVNLDCATVDAGTTGIYTLAASQIANTAGLFAFFGKRAYVALTATEMSCKQGTVEVIDQTATEEWEDTSLDFVTEGHESAFDPQGCILTDAVGSATGQTTTNIRLSGVPATAPKTGFYFEVTSGTGINQTGHVKTYTAGATFDVVPYVEMPIALGADSVVKFYKAARVPAHGVSSEGTIQTFDALDTAQDSQHSTTQGRLPAALGADGFMKSSLFGAMGTALTETAGQIAGAIVKFFNKAAPTGTVNSIPDVVAGAASGLAIVGSQMNATDPPGFKKATAVADLSWPMRDADGDLVTGLTVTGQIQKDGGAFAGLAGTIAEIGTTGMYQVTTNPALTATEMTADQVCLKFTATGAKATIIEMWTEP
jgi:hypothetical protein